MALKFHYNKTTIQQFRRQLAIREKALPILKNKETALRKEEKEMRKVLDSLVAEKSTIQQQLKAFQAFWEEFPNILSLEDPGVYYKKIVGVKVPEIREVSFRLADVSWWNYPAWVPSGMEVLQRFIALDIRIKIKTLQVDTLNSARKKTTQKVNLYEKVQIPAYEEAILKIKRFLEDRENISKAAQKIVKKRKERGLAA
ncbi:MAG: V-type ATP synthase subunit D [Cyclobacteriaceae bacterium]